MAILASSLTRADLLEAIQARRFFTTLDKNIAISFQINGNEMGSTVSGNSGQSLQILASDGDGELFTRVELLKNGIVENTWAPGVSDVTITETITTSDGDYYYIKVTQADGDEAISSPIFIEGGIINESPDCYLTSPADGAHFSSPQEILISASANDPDGTISQVEFYVDGNSIGTDNSEPFEISWNFPDNGVFSIYARAEDNLGGTGNSDPVSITVGTFSDIVSVRISSGNDDAEESVLGSMYLNSTDIELVYDTYNDAGNQTVGLRFTDLNIPKGAVINSASIDFVVDETSTGACQLILEGHDSDNSEAFTSSAFDISSRSRTSSNTSWSPADWNTAGIVQSTPDISQIIQEIVDRPGFSAGSAISIIITGNGKRTAEAYEGDASSAAILNVQYTVEPDNNLPQFTSDPVLKTPAKENTPYFGESLSENAADPDEGDVLTFSKISGPAWLTIEPDGSLSGTPLKEDVGLNSWQIKVEDGLGSDQATLQIMVDENVVVTYCESFSKSYSDEYIAHVSIGNLDNPSGGSLYSDHTNIVFSAESGLSYSISLTPWKSSNGSKESWSVWIDYNKDGDFLDSGEMVFSSDRKRNTVNGTIAIPDGLNGTTRMRVAMARDIISLQPCSTDSYLGEVEDYTVQFGEPVPQPPVADFSPLEATVIIGTSVSFTDLSSNDPTSWLWSFDGGSPSTSAEQNPVVAYNSLGTYSVSLVAANGVGPSTPKLGTVTVIEQGTARYCESYSSSSDLEWISNVEVSNLTNMSGASGYTYFDNMTAALSPGSNYTITVTPSFSSKAQREFFRVWIDFNGDKDFEDTGEAILVENNKKDAVSAVFDVPSGLSGQTRMRVSMKNGSAPGPCETFSGGEVEDYIVDFGSSKSGHVNPGNSMINKSFKVYPNPTSDLLFIDIKNWKDAKNIRLTELTGKTILEKRIDSNIMEIDLSSYPKGVYFLQIDDGIIRKNHRISKL
jgi:PKD repeat protein